MKIVFNERAWQEYMFWVSNDKMIVKKIYIPDELTCSID